MSGSGGVHCVGNIGVAQQPNRTEAPSNKLRVPLQFWFNTNPGLALPLIALQYHEVEFVINTQAAIGKVPGADLTKGNSLTNLALWCNYIYLDTDERRRFAQVSHEYLITQWQWQSAQSATSITLNFNHPVSELIWSGAALDKNVSTPTSLLGSAQTNPQITLKLNGTQRFAPQDLNYFSQYQVSKYHSGQGSRGGIMDVYYGGILGATPSICVYSFALNPEELQPSGTCNFSRIDNAQLVSTNNSKIGAEDLKNAGYLGSTQSVNIYARNYNVLRIMSGMGGLAYSN
jgi:hypothetical protein